MSLWEFWGKQKKQPSNQNHPTLNHKASSSSSESLKPMLEFEFW